MAPRIELREPLVQLGTAIVQRQGMDARQLNAIFWVVTLARTALAILTFPGAGFISALSGEPRLNWMLRLLSFTFLLNSLGSFLMRC